MRTLQAGTMLTPAVGEAHSAGTCSVDALRNFESCSTLIEHGTARLARSPIQSTRYTALATRQLTVYLDVQSKRPPWR
jgi:hypothetical protein